MLVQILVSGVAIGCVYGLIALALVLINKSTDVVNFAQGEIAMFGAFIAVSLNHGLGLPVIAMLFLALPLGALIGAVRERLVMRPLASGRPINTLIATIGLWMIFHYGARWILGFDRVRFPSLVSDAPVDLAGVRIAPYSLAIAFVTAVLLAVFYFFFEFSREGVAMGAASMNPAQRV